MIRVYIAPDYTKIPPHADNGGIRRVAEAMIKHFPAYGIEVVHNPSKAQVIINHGAMTVSHPGVPIVHVGHGLMWSRQPWGDGMQDVNRMVVDSMKQAVAHTAPSNWVNNAIRRGGYWYPETVYHGVDPTDFQPGQNAGYVLWNKARADYVSDPKDMLTLARRMRNRQFWTTISERGKLDANVRLLGVTSHEAMKEIVANAGVYLSTARETFGIGTLEALASGVPVAGWDWGGNSEIIVQGETGYLAPPGDYPALVECVELCFQERDRLSENAVEDARTRWIWEPRIGQYADIVKNVKARYYDHEGPKVSVIVTACRLDEFLPKCLGSVQEQGYTDWECLVIDDCGQESTRNLVAEYERVDKRFRYLPTPQNLGLPGARNFGLNRSRGLYIRHLDADDFLDRNALAIEADALDRNPGIHIVYGHLEVVRTDGSRVLEGSDPKRGGWPPDRFDWYMQMSHLNQIPSCNMARREVYERSGGYRDRMRRNEDAEFNCRVTSLGFVAAKVTNAVTYFHRERHDSKGALEWKAEGKEPDWTAWFPWRTGGTDYESALRVLRRNAGDHPNIPLVPFGAQGRPPKGHKFWYVHDYAYPVVSVIVTCGPGHEPYLIDALDSIQAQTYPDWECIVVNDTGREWEKNIKGAPWAKVINMGGNQGTSAARNAGFPHTRGRYIVWMDADDYWLPWFLQRMVGFAEQNEGVIFSDLIKHPAPNKYEIYRYQRDFEPDLVVRSMQYPGSSVLYPRKVIEAVFREQGGFDTKIPGMEDWDFQVCVHHLGFCGYHVDEPLFVYRMYSSTKRESDYNKVAGIRDYMNTKWSEYRMKGKKIVCGCRQKKSPAASTPSSTLTSSGNFSQKSVEELLANPDPQQMVTVEYLGEMVSTFSIKSRVAPQVLYRFGANPGHRTKSVFLADAEYLLGRSMADGRPEYRVVSGGSAQEAQDPTAFLGQPITG